MSEHEYCQVQHRGHLRIITLNRPQVMNALHPPASQELAQVFDTFENDPDAWVAIVTGAGPRAFCAGNDLKYQAAAGRVTHPDSGFGGLTGRFSHNKPIIAAVNGIAMGGGFEIALACDLIIASQNAVFALPEPHVGLAATAGGLLRLPRQIPLKQAMGIILTGRRVSADEGAQLGFVNEVVPEGQAVERAIEWAQDILAGSPMAIRAAKELVRKGLDDAALDQVYLRQKQFPAVRALYDSEDKIEGPRAFAEKRRPVWKGC
ncbi:MAG TPA: enoyl-CoA hydratase-related protein [Bordetella sp.]|nr:enoyl-CoA hydratase-related protein [Bordetella sp.]